MAALTLDEVTEALATCEVCRNEFDEGSRAPLLMPDCRHVFCKTCVETIADGGKKTDTDYSGDDWSRFRTQSREFPCPKCRQPIVLEGHSGVADLSKDIVTMNAVSFLSMKKKMLIGSVPCFDCPDKAKASHRCQTCCIDMCTTCTEAHKRVPRTRMHKVVELEALIKSGERFTMEDDPCDKHEDKKNEIYCKTCQMPLCVTCALVGHQGHVMDELGLVYKKALQQNHELLEQIDEKLQSLQVLNARQERIDQQSKRKQEKVEREISEMFRKITVNLEERRRALTVACTAAFQDGNAVAGSLTRAVTSLMKNLEETASALRNAERMTRPAQFIAWQREQLPSVRGKLTAKEPRITEPRDVRLIQSGLSAFCHSLDFLGSVQESSATPREAHPLSENLKELFQGEVNVKAMQLNPEDLAFSYIIGSEQNLTLWKMMPNSSSALVTILTCSSFKLSREKLNGDDCGMPKDVTLVTGSLVGAEAGRPDEGKLRRYPGTLGTLPLSRKAGTYWEVQMEISLKERIEASSMVAVELALAPEGFQDREEQVGRRQGWGVEVGVCRDLGDGLCLWGTSRGGVVCHTPLTDQALSSTTASPTRVAIGLMLANGKLSVYDVTRRRHLCQMTSVDSDVLPWFGLWNKEHFESALTLQTGNNLHMDEDKVRMLAADVL